MKQSSILTVSRLFTLLCIPITAVFCYTLLSILSATPENTVYLLRAVPLMLENGLAALTVWIGGSLALEFIGRKNRNRT